MSKQKSRRGKIRPYKVVKHEYVEVFNPLGNIPIDARRAALRELSTKAQATFDEKYPKTADWFSSYDALYLLAHCALYYLATPAGIDPEAIHCKLDFASFQLELLQAFALTKPRAESAALLGDKAPLLKTHMQEIGEALQLADLHFPSDLSEAEFRKQMVIHRMRDWTFAVRHWAYRDQMLVHLKDFFSGSPGSLVMEELRGISIPRLIDAMDRVTQRIEDRMNDHLDRMRSVFHATSFDEAVDLYKQAWPKSPWKKDHLAAVFSTDCQGDLERFKGGLVASADLWLSDVYRFTLDDVASAYGEDASTPALLTALRRWTLRFAELAEANPMHFLYANPVLSKPLIQVTEDSFFWALCGLYGHAAPLMLDLLIPEAKRGRYSDFRSAYLENRVSELFRATFPNAKVYRGSKFRDQPDNPKEYENDILIIIDTVAIIVECKSGRVDPPARRGAPGRLSVTFDDLIAAASTQALRFADFLQRNPQRHSFPTKSGATNSVDASRLLRFIPLSVTYESLGYVGANLKELALGGFIAKESASVSSMCFTDLEVVFDILDSQAQRIHYLSRRAEIEQTTEYLADELDLLAFYVDTGFNIGDWEKKGFLNIALKSKELDPYYAGRADGVSVRKPRVRLTDWWRAILTRLEEVRPDCWTEVAYVLLSVAYDDQIKFDQQVRELIRRIRSGSFKRRHNCAAMLSGTNTERPYGIIAFAYHGIEPQDREPLMRAMAGDFLRARKVFGLVVLAFDMNDRSQPYNALMYIPGNAEGALDAGRVLGMRRNAPDGFVYHLKSPRPR